MPAEPSGYWGEPAAPWRIIAERKIQEWIDDGGADRLTNKGQRLDLISNPFVPSDMRMAFDILRSAEAAPPWIEIGKEIEVLLTRAREEGRRFRDAQRRDRVALREIAPERAGDLRARMTERARRFADEHRARLRHINGQIDRFNAYC